jgi:hypothetical protein
MARILKWDVPVDDQEHEIGAGPVCHVTSQYGRIDLVQVWTFETEFESTKDKRRLVRVVGTGHEIAPNSNVLGSAVPTAGLVWHVIENGPLIPRPSWL